MSSSNANLTMPFYNMRGFGMFVTAFLNNDRYLRLCSLDTEMYIIYAFWFMKLKIVSMLARTVGWPWFGGCCKQRRQAVITELEKIWLRF